MCNPCQNNDICQICFIARFNSAANELESMSKSTMHTPASVEAKLAELKQIMAHAIMLGVRPQSNTRMHNYYSKWRTDI